MSTKVTRAVVHGRWRWNEDPDLGTLLQLRQPPRWDVPVVELEGHGRHDTLM